MIKAGSLVEVEEKLGAKAELGLVISFPSVVDGQEKALVYFGGELRSVKAECVVREVAFTMLLCKWAYVHYYAMLQGKAGYEVPDSNRRAEVSFRTSWDTYRKQGGIMPDMSPYDHSLPLMEKSWVLLRVVDPKTQEIDFFFGRLTGQKTKKDDQVVYTVAVSERKKPLTVIKQDVISVFPPNLLDRSLMGGLAG